MREINLKLIYVLLITISLFGVKAGWCAWTQDGGALNLDLNEGAGYPVVEMCGTIPYAFWVESGLPGVGAKGFIKCFVEGSWSQVGSYINENVDYSISCPDIAFLYSTPYIAWHEGPNPNLKLVYVKYFNGSSWVQLGSGSINNNPSEVAIYPSITFDNETPYIAWQENSGGINTEKIYVKYYDGNQWVQKGAPLNVNMSWPAYNPDIAIDNHTPYVVWNEYTGAKWHIYVKHFNGSDWEQNGNELNVDVNMNAVYPKISFSENTPYIVWQEYRSSGYQVYVKVKNGSSWDLVGSRCLNMDADNVAIYPRIAVSDTTPYVTWMEIVSGKDKVYVKHYNGSDWEQDGSGELNVGSNSNARYPSVATPGDGVVYVAFQDDEGGTNKVYVKHIGNPVDVITSPYNILPNHTILNTTMSMKISGVQFVAPVQVRLIRSSTCEIINGYNVNLVNENLITANFNLTGALAGIYNTEVIRPFYSKALNNSFDILELLEKPIQWDITDMGQMDSSTVGGIFSDIVVADGDNDGLKEIFAVCRNQKIFRFKNNDPIWLKTEVFSSAVVGEYYIDVMVADGNHNGGLDLYSASLNNNVYEYCSVNNWTQENVATVGAAVYSLCTGDGNNDGWVKLYAACANGHVYQYAKSTGSWTVEDCGSVGGEIYDVAVGDGNSDGEFEVYSAGSNNMIAQFKYNGASWNSDQVGTGGGKMYAVKVADADRDGKTEVYAACEDGKIYKYAWVISSWQKTEVGQGNGKMYDLAINDADNSGIDALYASCEDGHIYQFLWEDSVWKKNDLGTAGTPLLALDIGDGDNDNRYEIYAVGDNNHIYEFEASSEIPTPTPTITPTSTSTPVPGFDGRIISEKHIYAAPNPIRGHIANIVIFTNTSCEVSGKLFTTSNQEVLSFRRNYNIGKQIEHINMSNLANGVYLLLITAKNSEGVEEKVIKKIALIK